MVGATVTVVTAAKTTAAVGTAAAAGKVLGR